MADKKISELTNITGANVDDANDELTIVDSSEATTKAITRGELFSSVSSLTTTGDMTVGGDLTVNGTTVTIDTTTLDVSDKNITVAKDAPDAATADGAGLTVDGANATFTYVSAGDNWAFNKDVDVTGDITLSGTVDGRDVAADGTKLDGIEAGADVTDTPNVTAAGALMDSELTDIAAVKGLDQGVATTDSPSFVGGTFSGDLAVDTDTLFVDASASSVGIGITSPETTLHVRNVGASGKSFSNSSGLIVENNGSVSSYYVMQVSTAGENNAFNIQNNGYVSIGKASANTRLDVDGPIRCASYTVATVPSASAGKRGAIIYVTDEVGGQIHAFCDSITWRRVTDRTIIST